MTQGKPSKIRRTWILASIAIAALAVAALSVFALRNPMVRALLDPEFRNEMTRFGTVLVWTNRCFHDKDRTSYRELTEQALAGMMQSLDPFSSYMGAETYRDYRRQKEAYYGTGFRSWNLLGGHRVAKVFPGSPAHRAGLEVGDRIEKIDGEPAAEWTDQEFTQRMRGPIGTEVTIQVVGPGGDRTLALRREEIRANPVDNRWINQEGIGYVKLDEFTSEAGAEMKKALDEMRRQEMRGLVLDLRNNPGGSVDATVDVASLFLPPGSLVTTLRGPCFGEQEFRTDNEPSRLETPMAVLLNAQSGSGSETLAGALRHHGRALLVGETTAGKGSAQYDFNLSDGSGLKLTTAMLFLPDGSTAHGTGIEPDHTVGLESGTETQLAFQRSVSGEPDPEGFEALFGFEHLPDPQLRMAIDLLRHPAEPTDR